MTSISQRLCKSSSETTVDHSDGLGSVRLMVGLNDLKCFVQLKSIYNSKFEPQEMCQTNRPEALLVLHEHNLFID